MTTEGENRASLIAIVGPTGSGKSTLGLHLAGHFGGEIVNYDSVQLYRGLNIGSAKTPLAERRWIPHHLLDIAEANEEITAGDYARMARPVVRGIAARGALPILVGGTGFYLRALLAGLPPGPPRNPALRTRLSTIATRRPLALHRLLRRCDPPAAARIHPNDIQKLIRALELASVPGKAVKGEPFTEFQVLKFGLLPPRDQLYASLDRRAERMFEAGLVEELAALVQAFPEGAKALLSLGYRQAAHFVAGEITREEAIRECQTKTRQYAKRQLTWFRAEPGVHWLPGFGTDPGMQERALITAESYLKLRKSSS